MSYQPWPPHMQEHFERMEAAVGRSLVRLEQRTHETLDDASQRIMDELNTLRAANKAMLTALIAIRALEPHRMGDHWSWEEGLKPDDVFDLVDEALKPL